MLAHTQFSRLNLHKKQVVSRGTWSCLLTALCQPYTWTLLLVSFNSVKWENSQNHWMVEIERDFCRSSGLTALFTVGHLEQAAKDCVQMAFKYLQGWRYLNIPTISLGNQCQCSISITVHPECANSLSNLSRNRNLWQSRSRLGKATLK